MKRNFSHQCALRLLLLYPHAWHERYGDEAAAVLEERPATPFTLLDLFLGMVDAYMHNDLFTRKEFAMLQRLRNSQISIFISLIFFSIFWALYSLAGPSIYRSSIPIWDLASPAPNYAFVFPLVRNIGLFAIVTTLLGGGALIAVALKQACTRNQQNIPPVVCTLLSVFAVAQFFGLLVFGAVFHSGWQVLGLSLFAGTVLFFISTLLANVLRLRQGIKSARLSLLFMFPTLVPGLSIAAITLLFYLPTIPRISSGIYKNTLLLYMLALIGILSGSIIYLVQRLRRVEFTPRFLRFTFFLASLTALAMLLILGLLLYEAQVIYLYVNVDGWKLLSVPLLLIIVVCIAFPTIFSCISLWRGFRAQRALALG